MTDRPEWKLVLTDPNGRVQTRYFETWRDLEYPMQRAEQTGCQTQTRNIKQARQYLRETTEQLIERARTGMTTTQDAILIEKLVFEFNEHLPDEEKFLEGQ